MGRRDTSKYRVIRQDGVELLMMPDLVSHARNLEIDLKEFLFFRRLIAGLELASGAVLGRQTSLA